MTVFLDLNIINRLDLLFTLFQKESIFICYYYAEYIFWIVYCLCLEILSNNLSKFWDDRIFDFYGNYWNDGNYGYVCNNFYVGYYGIIGLKSGLHFFE